MVSRNPYEVLGVDPSMSMEEVKSKYRKLAKIYHPDGTNGNSEKFLEIQRAWEELRLLGSKGFNIRVGKITHKTLFTFRRV